MLTVPCNPDEINLPNVYDIEAVTELIDRLDTQPKPYGAKKLSECLHSICGHLERISKKKVEVERLINVVNGIPTQAQQQYYDKRKQQHIAQKLERVKGGK